MPTLTRQKQHVDVVKEVYNAFGRGDLKGLLNQLSTNVEWQAFSPVIAIRGMHRGHEGVRKFFEALKRAEEIQRLTPREFLMEGNTVVVLGEERLRFRENDHMIDQSFVHVFKLKDEKIVSFRGYVEADRMIEAFG